MESDCYYEIKDLGLIGKIEGNLPYIYDPEQGWISDKESLLLDRIMGYDPSEPDVSPYRIGNLDIMEQVGKISREEAEKRISIIQNNIRSGFKSGGMEES